MNGWFVARTKPNREVWAAENVAHQGFTYYLPRIMEKKHKVASARPLFASYIFVQATHSWHSLLGTFGIAGVVIFGEAPALMRDDIIHNLRALEVDGLVVLPAAPLNTQMFRPGTDVRVKGGVFSGCTGIFEGMQVKQRERVLLDFLGRKTSVLLAPELLEAA